MFYPTFNSQIGQKSVEEKLRKIETNGLINIQMDPIMVLKTFFPSKLNVYLRGFDAESCLETLDPL